MQKLLTIAIGLLAFGTLSACPDHDRSTMMESAVGRPVAAPKAKRYNPHIDVADVADTNDTDYDDMDYTEYTEQDFAGTDDDAV